MGVLAADQPYSDGLGLQPEVYEHTENLSSLNSEGAT